MLRIYFGDCEDVLYGPIWFKYNYDPSWFKDELVQAMVREIDHTEYIDDSVFDSPVLGKIPPERLSGGVKTMTMIYKMPDKVFDTTSCGW